MKRITLGIFLAAMATAGLASDKLGAGDAVRVTVFQQPDLTTEARISEGGTIKMPLVGEVKVAGMTAAAIAHCGRAPLNRTNKAAIRSMLPYSN